MKKKLSLGLILAALLALAAAACSRAISTDGEDEGALQGDVAAAQEVVTTANLQLRRAPTKQTGANVIGIVPRGTTLRVAAGAPIEGFYRVDILDDAVIHALRAKSGYALGESLRSSALEPGVEGGLISYTDDAGAGDPYEYIDGGGNNPYGDPDDGGGYDPFSGNGN